MPAQATEPSPESVLKTAKAQKINEMMKARQARSQELKKATNGDNPMQQLADATTPEPFTASTLSSQDMDDQMPRAKENLPLANDSTLSTEGQIRAEVARLKHDSKASINPDLPPKIRNAVIESQLSGREPIIPPFVAPKEIAPTPPEPFTAGTLSNTAMDEEIKASQERTQGAQDQQITEAVQKIMPTPPEPFVSQNTLSSKEMDDQMRASDKTVVESPAPIKTQPVSEYDQIVGEVARLQHDPKASIRTDLPPQIREAVMNSILSGEPPMKPSPAEQAAPTTPEPFTAGVVSDTAMNAEMRASQAAVKTAEDQRITEALERMKPAAAESGLSQETSAAPEASESAKNAEYTLFYHLNNRTSNPEIAAKAFTRENGKTVLTPDTGAKIADQVTDATRDVSTADLKIAAASLRKSIQREVDAARRVAKKQAETLAKAFGMTADKKAIQAAARDFAAVNTAEQTAQLAVINAVTAKRLAQERSTQAAQRQTQILEVKNNATEDALSSYKTHLEAQGVKVRRPSDLKNKYARDVVAGRYTPDTQNAEPEDKKPIDIASRRRPGKKTAIGAAAAGIAIGAAGINHMDSGTNYDASPVTSGPVQQLSESQVPTSTLPDGIFIDKNTQNAPETEKTIQGVIAPGEGLTQAVSRITGEKFEQSTAENPNPQNAELWSKTYDLAMQNRNVWESENPKFYAEVDKLLASGDSITPDKIQQIFLDTGGDNYSFMTHAGQPFTLQVK